MTDQIASGIGVFGARRWVYWTPQSFDQRPRGSLVRVGPVINSATATVFEVPSVTSRTPRTTPKFESAFLSEGFCAGSLKQLSYVNAPPFSIMTPSGL